MRHALPILFFTTLAGACTGPGGVFVDPCDEPGAICRIAGRGDGVNGFNGEGVIADQAMLYYPTALALTPDGRVVIDDFNNQRIRVIEEDGTVSDLAGSGFHAYAQEGPALDSPLENPIDVAFLDDGTFYIAELHAARVLYVDGDGMLTIVAGTGDPGYTGDGGPAVEAMISETAGVALGLDGTIFVADTDNHCIRAVGTDGLIATIATEGQDGMLLDSPERLRRAPDGTILVADTGNHMIRRLDPDTGMLSPVAGTGMPGFDGDGGDALGASLRGPTSAIEDDDGTIYIADAGNNVLRVVSPDGTIDTFAGTGAQGFTGDFGPALDATLNYPTDVLIGADGHVYVTDMLNGAVRRIAR